MRAKSLQSCPTLCHPRDCSSLQSSCQGTGFSCPWTFSRQEYWSGLPSPPPRDFPNPGIEPVSLRSSNSQTSDSLQATIQMNLTCIFGSIFLGNMASFCAHMFLICINVIFFTLCYILKTYPCGYI